MNTVGYFEIQSSDPQREIKFYGTLFGWKFNGVEFAPIEYYTIEKAGINGGLLKRPAPLPPEGCGTNAFVCSMQVQNFDHTADAILQNGGRIALAKFAVPKVCWQGYFLDADNNTFGIFEPNENAK